MNERINQLAEQCRIEKYNQHGDLIEFGFDEEKFAELIVLECAGVSENHKGMNDKYFIADAIKKHFGVSE